MEEPIIASSAPEIPSGPQPTQLVLLPLPIGELSWGWMNTPNYIDAIMPIKHWVAEDARTLRRFISSLKLGIVINDLDIFEFNIRSLRRSKVQPTWV
jgi:hypothetical protein